jgi:hypothetical protein
MMDGNVTIRVVSRPFNIDTSSDFLLAMCDVEGSFLAVKV